MDRFHPSSSEVPLFLLLAGFLVYFGFTSAGLSKTKEAFHFLLTKIGVQPDQSVVVPSSQILLPAGVQISFPGRPVDLALSPDGKLLAVLSRKGIVLIDLVAARVKQTVTADDLGGSYGGIIFSLDGKTLYSSSHSVQEPPQQDSFG
jgi:hypothetical protein